MNNEELKSNDKIKGDPMLNEILKLSITNNAMLKTLMEIQVEQLSINDPSKTISEHREYLSNILNLKTKDCYESILVNIQNNLESIKL